MLCFPSHLPLGVVGNWSALQGGTTCGRPAGGLRENGELARKWRGNKRTNEKLERKWRENEKMERERENGERLRK